MFVSAFEEEVQDAREAELSRQMDHGPTACRDKCMNFLWVLWLITAPNKNVFADVLPHIRSFTTDQGVEAYMVTEGIATALTFAKYLGVQLPEIWSRTI